MYDHITPNQWVLGLMVSLGAFALLWRQLWRCFPSDEGHVMSPPKVELGSEEARSGAGTGATSSVPPQQHQAAPELVPDLTSIKTYFKQYNVNDPDLVDILALLRRSNDDNLISANKIRDIVGGNEAEVKARVAALRPKPPSPKPTPSIRRPQNGW